MHTTTKHPVRRALDVQPDQLLLVEPVVLTEIVPTINGIAVYAHRDSSDWLWSFNVLVGSSGHYMLYAHRRPDTDWSMPLRMAQPVIDGFGNVPLSVPELIAFARYFLAPS